MLSYISHAGFDRPKPAKRRHSNDVVSVRAQWKNFSSKLRSFFKLLLVPPQLKARGFMLFSTVLIM